MNKNTLSFFNLPNLFTTANFVCGIFSIILSFSGKVELAIFPIFLAAFFDFFDGFFARLLKCGSELGKQLDSFADLISFGLAPGFFMLHILIDSLNINEIENNGLLIVNWFKIIDFSNYKLIIPFVAFLIPIFSMFRLAKFNIDTRQDENFIGLPTPANTLFFSTFPLILKDNKNIDEIFIFSPYFLCLIIILFSFLLISELPLFSLKFKHFKFRGNEIRFIFLVLTLISILIFYFWSLGIIVILYIVLSIIQEYIYKKNKKNEV